MEVSGLGLLYRLAGVQRVGGSKRSTPVSNPMLIKGEHIHSHFYFLTNLDRYVKVCLNFHNRSFEYPYGFILEQEEMCVCSPIWYYALRGGAGVLK